MLSRQVDVGDFLESGATVLELGDLSNLEVTVQVCELDISRLSVGQSARVQLDAFPGEGSINGQIKRISPVADSTSRLIPVQVSVPNVDGQIGSKMVSGGENFWLIRQFDQRLQSLIHQYARLLGWVLQRRIITVAIAFLIFGGGSLLMASQIPQEILPSIATGQANVRVQFPPGTTVAKNQAAFSQ